MSKKNIWIFSLIIVILLVSNVIFINKYFNAKANLITIEGKTYDRETLENNLAYVLRLKLRTYNDAISMIVFHLTNSHHNITEENLHDFLKGYRNFLNPNVVGMIEGMLLENDLVLRNMFSDLDEIVLCAEDILENTPDEEKEIIIDAYINLGNLLDENKVGNQENSLWYYILTKENKGAEYRVTEKIQSYLDILKSYQ